MTERKFITVDEFVALHEGRLKRAVVYDMVRRGQILKLPIGKGRNFLVPSDAMDTLYREQELAHERTR